jgi:hydroxymethylbilane synthase
MDWSNRLKVGLRDSLLSRAQLSEFQAELGIELMPVFTSTRGDCDLKSSLRTLEKSDFFTDEIDRLVLSGQCDLGLHSAKDLPEPLPEGLVCAAVTRGLDPRDALVFRQPLGPRAVVATSSLRRAEAVLQWRPDLCCVDIRGPVDARLAQLDAGNIDGLVVAEAALIRLGQTHRQRIYLDGYAPLQGRLAAVIRHDNHPLAQLLQKVHAA